MGDQPNILVRLAGQDLAEGLIKHVLVQHVHVTGDKRGSDTMHFVRKLLV